MQKKRIATQGTVSLTQRRTSIFVAANATIAASPAVTNELTIV